MKRHNMSGQPASHGVSQTHRKTGSSGGMGRVWPGKRNHGHMGCVDRIHLNLQVSQTANMKKWRGR